MGDGESEEYGELANEHTERLERILDYDEMTADDWEWVLENFPVKMELHAMDGSHIFEWEPEKEHVMFYAHGSNGYDYNGTRSALEECSGQSEGIVLSTPMNQPFP